MKKKFQSPVIFLVLMLLSCVLTITAGKANDSADTEPAATTESSESAASVPEETSSNIIWQSISHRF